MKKENESSSFPKTILGKVLSKLAEILGITAYILYYSSERFEKNKNIARQIIVVIVVPVALTILLDGSLNVSKYLIIFLLLLSLGYSSWGYNRKMKTRKLIKRKWKWLPPTVYNLFALPLPFCQEKHHIIYTHLASILLLCIDIVKF